MAYKVELMDEAKSFLKEQDPKMAMKIVRSFDLLEAFGTQLREPHSKKIKGIKDLFELRIQLGNNICRLFYFHFGDKLVVVTSGFIKKENKTNPREIEKAVQLMNEFKAGAPT